LQPISLEFLASALNLPAISLQFSASLLNSSRVDALAMTTLPVYLSHALRVAELPPHHRDPFDRLLIAQSQIERLPLMTADATLAAYDVEIIWMGNGRAPRRSKS
jgi:PIN domain nuclease of toxin-antitoxin system